MSSVAMFRKFSFNLSWLTLTTLRSLSFFPSLYRVMGYIALMVFAMPHPSISLIAYRLMPPWNVNAPPLMFSNLYWMKYWRSVWKCSIV